MLDPSELVSATEQGGKTDNKGYGIADDREGAAYITGAASLGPWSRKPGNTQFAADTQ